jgi:hypothetical protein
MCVSKTVISSPVAISVFGSAECGNFLAASGDEIPRAEVDLENVGRRQKTDLQYASERLREFN